MKLEEIRKNIDAVDRQIVALLLKRFKLIKKIALIKKGKGQPVHDQTRENGVLQNVREFAKEKYEQRFIVNIYKHIIKESIKTQL